MPKFALGVILFVNPALVFSDIFTDLYPVNVVVQPKVSHIGDSNTVYIIKLQMTILKIPKPDKTKKRQSKNNNKIIRC